MKKRHEITDGNGYRTVFIVHSERTVEVQEFYKERNLGWDYMSTPNARKRYLALTKEHGFK